jgi:hypothetical protein
MLTSRASVATAERSGLSTGLMVGLGGSCTPARAGNRRFRLLSALRTHTKAPYKMDLNKKTLRALNRPWAARTVAAALLGQRHVDGRLHLSRGRRCPLDAPHCTD